jgi:hypothetical protein
LSKQFEVFGESCAQLHLELCPATKKSLRRQNKIRKLLKVFVAPNLLVEKFPQPLNQVQIR